MVEAPIRISERVEGIPIQPPLAAVSLIETKRSCATGGAGSSTGEE